MEKWEEGYYITAMAGSTGGSSLVVMSKGTPYTQQSYKARILRHDQLRDTRRASTPCLLLIIHLQSRMWSSREACWRWPCAQTERQLECPCLPHEPACVELSGIIVCGAAQVSDSFPFKWINKKWKEGFYVTSMATSHTRWAVVMSRNAGFIDQVTPAATMSTVVLAEHDAASASSAALALNSA